jgi:hypothetical protein
MRGYTTRDVEAALTEASAIEPMSTVSGAAVTAFPARRCEILADGECPMKVRALVTFGFKPSQYDKL